MVRVIGRIDLADEVQRALAAAGIESNVVTAGPMAAATAAGEDGSVDVVVQDLGTCAGIKRKARHRPVVVITTAKDERRVLANMRGASGPDAHVVWPASGEDLRAAVARAVATAGTVRPRIPRGQLPSIVLFLVGAVLLLGGLAGMLGSDSADRRRRSPTSGAGSREPGCGWARPTSIRRACSGSPAERCPDAVIRAGGSCEGDLGDVRMPLPDLRPPSIWLSLG